MKGKVFCLLMTVAFVFSATAYAHHSAAAAYREDQTITIKGKLVQFMFRNPHSLVAVMAPDEKGVMQRWSVTWAAAGQLGGQGLTRETLRFGDEVIITGNPGRSGNPDHRVRMLTIKRTRDGFGWGTRAGESVD